MLCNIKPFFVLVIYGNAIRSVQNSHYIIGWYCVLGISIVMCNRSAMIHVVVYLFYWFVYNGIRIYIGVGFSPFMPYHGKLINSKAEWNEALEEGLRSIF